MTQLVHITENVMLIESDAKLPDYLSSIICKTRNVRNVFEVVIQEFSLPKSEAKTEAKS